MEIQEIKMQVALPPATEGMKVLFVGNIPMNKILGMRGDNTVRTEGIDQKKVNQHMKNIKNGDYVPYRHIPPVVTKKIIDGVVYYELIDGEHRYQAHDNLDETEMWVAIAELDNYEVIEQYKSNANDHDKNVTNPRTDKDIQTTVKNIIVEMGYAPTVKKITELLKNQKVKPSEMNDFVKAVGMMLKVNTNTIQSYSTGIAQSTAMKMMKDEHYVTQMFKSTNGNDIQYDIRSIFAVMEKKLAANDPSLPVSIVAYWSHQNEEGLISARSVKQSVINKKVQKLIKMADMMKSPKFTMPKVVPLPQTKKDIQNNDV
tara:strand:- start:335 stop:1279 length:945 start_codon:yes stop_codon:yes gene_type:complete